MKTQDQWLFEVSLTNESVLNTSQEHERYLKSGFERELWEANSYSTAYPSQFEAMASRGKSRGREKRAPRRHCQNCRAIVAVLFKTPLTGKKLCSDCFTKFVGERPKGDDADGEWLFELPKENRAVKTQCHWLFEAPFQPIISRHEGLGRSAYPQFESASKWESKESSLYEFDAMATAKKGEKDSEPLKKKPDRVTSEYIRNLKQRAKTVLKKLEDRSKKAKCGTVEAEKSCASIQTRISRVKEMLGGLDNKIKTSKQQQHSYMTAERLERLITDINQDLSGEAPQGQPSASLLSKKYASPTMWGNLRTQANAIIQSGKANPLKNGGYEVILGPFPDVTGWLRDRNFTPGSEKAVHRLRVILDSTNNWHYYPYP